MWHIYFDGCNTAEESAGQNELEAPKDVSWEVIEHPLLEDLERANDFTHPRKVRVMPGFWEHHEVLEMARLAQINPLDLTGLPPIDGTPTTSH
jgi:hypothetical protein